MGLLSKAVSDFPAFERPPSQGGLLKLISQKTLTAAAEAPSPAVQETDSGLEKAVMEKLSGAYTKFGALGGLIVEALEDPPEETFLGRLGLMVSAFGVTQSLSSGRSLVLFTSKEDSGLIGAHLEKTLPGKIVFSFTAKKPEEALPLLQSYL